MTTARPWRQPPGRLRLAVIGDTQHYRDSQGRLCTHEPVVSQLDRWASLFDEVVVCAPLDPGPPPVGFGPYEATNVTIVPVRRAGGNTVRAKLAMLPSLPGWAIATRRVARQVDAVHIRCPSNIGLVALLATWRATPRRHALYAGVWRPYEGEPPFFALQRRILGSRWFDGPVSVYAGRQRHRPNLEPFFSPSYSRAYWEATAPDAAAKLDRIATVGESGPCRLVTVGRLTVNKNQRTVIEAVARVVAAGHDVRLDVYGDGPCRVDLEARVAELGLAPLVTFHGTVSHQAVMEAFRDADLHLLATRQEGYGKVLVEGMAHAVVPVFSESPMAGEISGDGTRGLVFERDDAAGLADHVVGLLEDRARWRALATEARAFSERVTLDSFADRVREVLERHWELRLRPRAEAEAGS